MISQTVEYALRALVFLAAFPISPMTTEKIFEHTMIPLSYLRKLMQQLKRAGLVDSQKGKKGGFILAKEPQSITVLDIVNAIDPIRPITSCPLRKNPSNISLCPLHKMLQDIAVTTQEKFASISLNDLFVHSNGCRSLIE